ncbi:glycerophosphodiester phosphodiesterase [Nonomuraea phyllanthi]|uniref:glycerophosphodiester phosphodiesterase n=1 Tax=Nonomuraea phyllanthi TaxID=2219224 RepID=UPI001D1520B9|nr:glycerophosphodiester phosphodiesterase family protein [Nonomuraea phyllanthi]
MTVPLAALMLTSLLAAPSAALPACPQVFAHGGYPTGANAWERDQVRQPNNPKAIRQYKSWGASGVEADLQLTKNGTKAVMWHNTSTWGLTGTKKPVTEIWWAAGSTALKGRTITRGPFKGETVHTFREWLAAMKSAGMVGLVEIKTEARQSLLSSTASIRTRAWAEVLDPVKERYRSQEIILYSHDSAIAAELRKRVSAAGMTRVLSGGPIWPEVTKWEEPPPSWKLNENAWKSALQSGAKRVATDYTSQFSTWLKGRCQ